MSTEKPRDPRPEGTKAASPDDLVQADPEASFELTDDQLSRVSGGRVKTSDKHHKAMMDYLKG